MTPELFAEEMRKIQLEQFAKPDPEIHHNKADELMCRLLESLGYGEGIKIFRDLHKWYC